MGLENPKHLPAPGRFFCKLLQLTATSGWSECSGEESAGRWRHKRAHSFGRGGLVEREQRKSPAWTGCWKRRRSERAAEGRGGGGREGGGGGRGGGEAREEEEEKLVLVAARWLCFSCWLLLLLGGAERWGLINFV